MLSKGEQKISNIFRKENITFIREKTYKDLRRGRLRFDFYLPNSNTLIEFQGKQHYEQVKRFQKTYSQFTQGQGRDREKINYCLAHHIKLYCIPFWELENLKVIEDLFQERFLAKDKYKNSEDWRNYLKN